MADPIKPARITKRDIEKLKYQRELMRKANLTGPATMIPGEVLPVIRRFAQETFMQMSSIDPESFRGKTVGDWEKAIKKYMMTRRPEFKKELISKLMARYGHGGGGNEPAPNVLMLGASKGIGGGIMKKAALRSKERKHGEA